MVKSLKLVYVSLVLLFGFSVVVYQNMSLRDFDTLGINDVDDEARRDQARELLGNYYNGSIAQKLEGQKYLNYLVFKQVDQQLRSRWKNHLQGLVQAIITDSEKFEFDPIFILAVIQTESRFNPDAIGTSGELGLMQIRPRTGAWLAKKFKLPWKGSQTLHDPVMNVRLGIRYFAQLREDFRGKPNHYVPAFNMGPTKMRRIQRIYASQSIEDPNMYKREYAIRVMKNYLAMYEQMSIEHKKLEKLAQLDPETPRMFQ